MASRGVQRSAVLAIGVGLLFATAGCSGITETAPTATPTLTPATVPGQSPTLTPTTTDVPPRVARPRTIQSPPPHSLTLDTPGPGYADEILVQNHANRSRTVAVVVERNGTRLVDTSVTLAPDEQRRLLVVDYGTYSVRLGYSGTAVTRTFTVPTDDRARGRVIRFGVTNDGIRTYSTGRQEGEPGPVSTDTDR